MPGWKPLPQKLSDLQLSDVVALAVCCLLPLSLGCGLAAQGRNVDGVRYFQQGNYPVAMAKFQEAMRTDPQNPDSYYNAAATSHRMGLVNRDANALSQAESLYNTCLSYNPNHVDCRRGLAVLLTETGRTTQAFTMLNDWAAKSPSSADARVELARLSEEVGDNRNAEYYLTEALRLDVGNWRAHAALGRQRELSGNYQQAIVNYQRAQQLNPYQPQLASKVQELTTRMAQGGLSPGALPTGNTQVNTTPGTVGPFQWTNPPSSAPANIIASPARATFGNSASMPAASRQY
ncbi:photosystem I assembly protein Ycf3 [Anatilimnocola aggregata]|uniref:Photosystem I assembly protein Ycf3 n=1 Tax=Anatilimnocola aggregata TaxID=2528021 RepID=A0A517YAW2_9BACT|nr:tetratricopeptide repeat protein [Anatilimnocola aggregata]QDU27302.1 photosystem I assembly protein Ycf3 [Anatilimnocola aggregata]